MRKANENHRNPHSVTEGVELIDSAEADIAEIQFIRRPAPLQEIHLPIIEVLSVYSMGRINSSCRAISNEICDQPTRRMSFFDCANDLGALNASFFVDESYLLENSLSQPSSHQLHGGLVSEFASNTPERHMYA